MAGRGPAPKDPGQRRRYNQPARSEWVDLEPLTKPVLPPAEKTWSTSAQRAWRYWRQDPVTSQYGPADIHAILELARWYDIMDFAEQRRRMNELGLTPKGKRDLRWRTPAEVKTLAEQKTPVRRLHIVDKET